jgi:hypothetical protein
MAFDIDPDKPNTPALARILSGMSILCLIGSAVAGMLSFSAYDWINEGYAMATAGIGFLLALVFAGQAKTLELLAVVSARLKSRFAIEGLAKSNALMSGTPMPAATPTPARPITQPVKERIIHVPDEQAREQGFKVR